MVNPTPINSAKTKVSEAIRAALGIFISAGSVAELRVIDADSGNGFGKTYSGYFNDLDQMATQAAKFDGKAPAVYFTVNPCSEALLARAANRTRAVKKEPLTADHDIARRSWFMIDVDPVRPKGISSTDEEHTYAQRKAADIRDYLTSLGWPLPVVADSGNGGHLNYRVDLPNDKEAAELIKAVLGALSDRFSDDRAEIDRTVFNAARIWKLYGTSAKKGDST